MSQDNPANEGLATLHILVDQVGRLTEGLTEIKFIAREQNQAIQRMADVQEAAAKTQNQAIQRMADVQESQNQAIQRMADAQEATARTQNQAIQRMADAQETTAKIQSENVSRLIRLLERST